MGGERAHPSPTESRDQFPVKDTLAFGLTGDNPHLVLGVGVPNVVPSIKLREIPVKMLFAEMVESTLIAALKRRQERLNAICVYHSPTILASTVIDALMRPVDTYVGSGVVHIDLRGFIRRPFHDTVQRRCLQPSVQEPCCFRDP